MPAGRPFKYDPKFNRQVFKLALLSATDKEIADFLEIAESTLYEWKKDYPQLSEALKRGKEIADSNVANRLYKRAMGYEVKTEKIFQYEGKPVIVPTVEKYPPDPTAAIFWLKNRRPKEWRDRHEVDHTSGGEPLKFTGIQIIDEGSKIPTPSES